MHTNMPKISGNLLIQNSLPTQKNFLAMPLLVSCVLPAFGALSHVELKALLKIYSLLIYY